MPMMKPELNNNSEQIRKEGRIPTVSAVLSDGTIVESLFDHDAKRTSFVLVHNGEMGTAESIPIDSSARLIPYSPRNNLLAHEVVLLPSQPEEYDSEDRLVQEIQSFIHR